MNINELPFPRLELRWSDIPDAEPVYEGASYSYDVKCDYILVISPPDELDIRSNIETDTACGYAGKNVEHILSTTKSTRVPIYDGVIETPFRDGVHAIRDAKKLKLPIFVTYRNMCNPYGPE